MLERTSATSSKQSGSGHGNGGCPGRVDLLRGLPQPASLSLPRQGAGDVVVVVGRERGGAGAVGHGAPRAAAGRQGRAWRGGVPPPGRAAGVGARPRRRAWRGARAAVRGRRRHERRDAAQEVGPLRLHRAVDRPVLHQDERPLPRRRRSCRRWRGEGRQAPRRLWRRPQIVDRGEDAPRRRVQEPGVARRRLQQVRGRRLRRRGGGEQAAVRHHRGSVLYFPPAPPAARGCQVISVWPYVWAGSTMGRRALSIHASASSCLLIHLCFSCTYYQVCRLAVAAFG